MDECRIIAVADLQAQIVDRPNSAQFSSFSCYPPLINPLIFRKPGNPDWISLFLDLR